MFGWLATKSNAKNAAETLYGEIVAGARQPIFYQNLGVPDTVEGRFELIAIHLVLVIHRLGQEGQQGADLARSINETCMTDLDDNMREIGIGDLAVPRKVKKAAAALYDRHRDILAALADQNGEALEASIQRDIGQLPGAGALNAHAIAKHVVKLNVHLASIPATDLLEGHLSMTIPVTL
jgi:cytochrome b pre-mRNA-processing protein 3